MLERRRLWGATLGAALLERAYWRLDSDFVVYDVERDTWVEPLRKALVP